MSKCIYPGSFDPWHEGHEDILLKALKAFDHVVIAIGTNGAKINNDIATRLDLVTKELQASVPDHLDRITIVSYKGLLSDYVESVGDIVAVVRGIRDEDDYRYEKTVQYWNEDFGLDVPFCFFFADRNLVHYSSSAVKEVHKLLQKTSNEKNTA